MFQCFTTYAHKHSLKGSEFKGFGFRDAKFNPRMAAPAPSKVPALLITRASLMRCFPNSSRNQTNGVLINAFFLAGWMLMVNLKAPTT